MKFGIRTPNIKSRIKARTTGKIKRKMKKAVNPLYGKKGMGWINDPKKALYNKVYNKTTIGIPTPLPKSNHKSTNTAVVNSGISSKNKLATLLLCIFMGPLGIHRFYVLKIGTGILYLLTGGVFFIGWFKDILSIACNRFTDGNGDFVCK